MQFLKQGIGHREWENNVAEMAWTCNVRLRAGCARAVGVRSGAKGRVVETTFVGAANLIKGLWRSDAADGEALSLVLVKESEGKLVDLIGHVKRLGVDVLLVHRSRAVRREECGG